MCRVTMLQTHVYRITSESPQKRTGVFSLEHYLASRTLLSAGHVARLHKNRLPKRLMLCGSQDVRPGTCRGGGMKHRHNPKLPPAAS